MLEHDATDGVSPRFCVLIRRVVGYAVDARIAESETYPLGLIYDQEMKRVVLMYCAPAAAFV
jgi:hypothetical protein